MIVDKDQVFNRARSTGTQISTKNSESTFWFNFRRANGLPIAKKMSGQPAIQKIEIEDFDKLDKMIKTTKSFMSENNKKYLKAYRSKEVPFKKQAKKPEVFKSKWVGMTAKKEPVENVEKPTLPFDKAATNYSVSFNPLVKQVLIAKARKENLTVPKLIERMIGDKIMDKLMEVVDCIEV